MINPTVSIQPQTFSPTPTPFESFQHPYSPILSLLLGPTDNALVDADGRKKSVRFDHTNEPASSTGTALASQTALALTAPASQILPGSGGIAFVPKASEQMLMPKNSRFLSVINYLITHLLPQAISSTATYQSPQTSNINIAIHLSYITYVPPTILSIDRFRFKSAMPKAVLQSFSETHPINHLNHPLNPL